MLLTGSRRLGHLCLASFLAVWAVLPAAAEETRPRPSLPVRGEPTLAPPITRVYPGGVVPASATGTTTTVRSAPSKAQAQPADAAAGTASDPPAVGKTEAPASQPVAVPASALPGSGPAVARPPVPPMVPSLAPTAVPSISPSAKPTVVPRAAPSVAPMAVPATVPSAPQEATVVRPVAPAASPESEAATAPDEPLRPIPDAQLGPPAKIEAASFNGVTPGVTTLKQLQASWGPPKQVGKRGDVDAHLYSVEPFDRVEVTFAKDKVASVVIRLDQPFPAKTVAEQLALSAIRPVLVSNELGEILGQAYPERGVLFSFEPSTEPGKTTMRVVQIILEPIGAEPFMLRAETNLDSNPELCLADLDQALRMTPANARGHWLRAKVLATLGRQAKALEASAEAVRLDPGNSHYYVTRAQILGQAGQYEKAVEAAKKALEAGDNRPHVKARALCLLGDLVGTGPQRDYKQALDYHIEAIKVADPLGVSPHPAIRLAAKEVLVDAHLGAAGDIAWGRWKQKETAVPKWLERAAAFAQDLIENDGGTEEYRFRVASRALAAYVGAQGKLDPADWVKQTLEIGGRLIDTAKDPVHKQQVAWDLGMALYDALQVYQMRADHERALACGEKAIAYLEQGGVGKRETLAYSYLLGRVYFRLGAIRAVGQQNHRAAVAWFDKAEPLLSKPVPEEALADLGRHGETFVSMAVSYWEAGQQDKALELTKRGVAFMEQAVKNGTSDPSILAVPYGNLATMHKALGQAGQAQQWAEMAAKSKGTSRQ